MDLGRWSEFMTQLKTKLDLRKSEFRKKILVRHVNYNIDGELDELLIKMSNKLQLKPSVIVRGLLKAGIKNGLNQLEKNIPFEAICKNIEHNTDRY